jgi:MFS family permease
MHLLRAKLFSGRLLELSPSPMPVSLDGYSNYKLRSRLTRAGLSEILPNKYRGMGLAWTEFNLSSWAIAGTLLANAMLTKASWRVMFYIATGYGAFSLIGTACVYFPPSHPRPDGKTKWQEFKELDFIGAILFVAGLAVFLYGLNSGGNTYPWKAAGTLAPLILGLIVFLGAFIYDFFIPKDPLFPW